MFSDEWYAYLFVNGFFFRTVVGTQSCWPDFGAPLRRWRAGGETVMSETDMSREAVMGMTDMISETVMSQTGEGSET